jgi:hypothetical protein
MPHFKFVHRFNIRTLWEGEAETLCAALETAIEGGADLEGADLEGADLEGADLEGADLARANLRGADLTQANLTRADLEGADLTWADLTEADLTGADLTRANLTGADIAGTDLTRANLTRANLRGAKEDFYAVLRAVPAEVPALRLALVEGRVDGSTYEGTCACLVGTIANARHCFYRAISDLAPNANRPAERWFLAIREGHTPETNPVSAITLGWIDEFLSLEIPAPQAQEATP